jgi:dephospho-CoA kinase
MIQNRKLIGLTGTNGAGKGEAAAFFMAKGYEYHSLSDILRDELRRKGQEISRDNLIKTGNQIRKTRGPDVLARLVLTQISGHSVIDSIRNPHEVEFLKREKNFILLAIDAPVELRYKRVKKRGRDESAASMEEFIRKEQEEMTTQQKGQQLQTCIKMADHTIMNEGTLEAFHLVLEQFL